MPRSSPPTAVVIGAGLGGLATAAHLAQAGWRVTVLEKNSAPGGRACQVRLGPYRFDAGPTILLAPDVVAETWTLLGASLHRCVELLRVDPASRVWFADGQRLELAAGAEARRAALAAFGPEVPAAVERYLQQGGAHYREVRRLFLDADPRPLWAKPRLLSALWRLHALEPLAGHLKRYVTDPRLHAAFCYQAMYVGASPFVAPATLSLIPYLEHMDGVYYPRGGLYALVESLAGLAEGHGVALRFNAPVAAIEVEGDRASGVRLEDGERQTADVVVANADLPYVYDRLLPPSAVGRRMARRPMGSSAIVFLWGLRGPRDGALAHHNSFLSEVGFRESFEAIFDRNDVPEEPSFYLAAPSRSEPAAAPEGGDAWMVLVPAGHLDVHRPQPWPERVARVRAKVLARLAAAGIPDVAGRIEQEEVLSPPVYAERWNLSQGSAFGLAHTLGQMAWFRPGQGHPRLSNLHFVGASTQPGSGIPNVLVSARQVASRILGASRLERPGRARDSRRQG